MTNQENSKNIAHIALKHSSLVVFLVSLLLEVKTLFYHHAGSAAG